LKTETIEPISTVVSEIETESIVTEPVEKMDALQTMLSTDITLSYPLGTNKIIRPYTTDSVYFKTLNVWKPHLGVDFEGELGESVNAMIGGAVTKVYDDKMYGKTVEVSVNNSTCIYSGLECIIVKEGDIVKNGDKLGVVGSVPFETDDESHIHVAVKVDNNYVDPLSFIKNNE
jgi:murein DD-endopeptidase MepM/ murein hydrolase activator NlpD